MDPRVGRKLKHLWDDEKTLRKKTERGRDEDSWAEINTLQGERRGSPRRG